MTISNIGIAWILFVFVSVIIKVIWYLFETIFAIKITRGGYQCENIKSCLRTNDIPILTILTNDNNNLTIAQRNIYKLELD